MRAQLALGLDDRGIVKLSGLAIWLWPYEVGALMGLKGFVMSGGLGIFTPMAMRPGIND